jgi:YfiH family protein
MTASPSLITPHWPAPANVGALSTTRIGGVSTAPFASFNLGDHVDDQSQSVSANRQQLQRMLGEGVGCQWLRQVHGINVVPLDRVGAVIEADAATTQQAGVACLVMTADCLPVLFCDRQGTRVAAAHAGWRGLVDGVLEATLGALGAPAEDVICWLGPAIGPQAFEVGDEVRHAFCIQQPGAQHAFAARAVPGQSQKWLADIYQLARLRLQRAGVTAIYGGDYCTFSDTERFFSYRRDGRTGRMASLIWLKR